MFEFDKVQQCQSELHHADISSLQDCIEIWLAYRLDKAAWLAEEDGANLDVKA
jgi:hypothetical protein